MLDNSGHLELTLCTVVWLLNIARNTEKVQTLSSRSLSELKKPDFLPLKGGTKQYKTRDVLLAETNIGKSEKGLQGTFRKNMS